MTRTHRNITLLGWYNFFSYCLPSAPILIIYFHAVTGSFALAMGLLSVMKFATAIFEIPTGIISDFLGRRRTLIAGAVCYVLAYASYAVADDIVLLAVGATLVGLADAFISGTDEALLLESLKEDDEGDRFAEMKGKATSMVQAGLSVGALISIPLVALDMRFAIFFSAGMQVCMLITSLFFIEPHRHEPLSGNVFAHLSTSLRTTWRNTKLRYLTFFSALRIAQGDTMFLFFPVFIASVWPAWAIGITRAASNALGFLGFRFAGRLVNRFGALPTLITSSTVDRGLMISALLLANRFSPLIIPIGSFMYGVVTTADSTLKQAEFTNRERATMGSVVSFVASMFYGILALIFGVIADHIGATHTLLVGEGVMIIVLIGYVWLLWHYQRLTRKSSHQFTRNYSKI